MQLLNKTRQTTITNSLIIAKGLIESTIGLLNKPQGTAMLFKTRWGIHTFGMKYPIDVLILDKLMKVISIKRNLKPNQIFFWNPKYSTIVELPSSNIKIHPGDQLKLK